MDTIRQNENIEQMFSDKKIVRIKNERRQARDINGKLNWL